MQDKVRGPFSDWEVKLICSKYRDFFVCQEEGVWNKYRSDIDLKSIDVEKPKIMPDNIQIKKVGLYRFVKRKVFGDNH